MLNQECDLVQLALLYDLFYFGGQNGNRTRAWGFCRPQRYHFAIWPYRTPHFIKSEPDVPVLIC